MTNMYSGSGDHPGNVDVVSGSTSVAGQGFSGSEVETHVNDANITAPDDSEQTETGNFPFVTAPGTGKYYEGRETGDVGP